MATITRSIGTGTSGAGTGTVSCSATTAVTGTGTSFTTELSAPGVIEISGNPYDIASITDNTNLVLTGNGPNVSDVSYNIGSRTYSTVTAWEADSYDWGTSADDCIGEMYNDSTFDEGVTLNAGANSVVLSVQADERHTGSEGTGARFVKTAGTAIVTSNENPIRVEWFEADFNGNNTPTCFTANGGGGQVFDIGHVLYHGVSGATSGAHPLIQNDSRNYDIVNTMIYDLTQTAGGSQTCNGVGSGCDSLYNLLNVTIHDIVNNNGTGPTYCVMMTDSDISGRVFRNIIATDPSGTASGTQACFDLDPPTNATCSHNISSDTSASGTASHESESSSSLFVANSSPYDLHLVAGATNAIDGGNDEGTTPTGVEIDIDGRDRDAEGDTWDIGAHEYVAAGGGLSIPVAMNSYRQRNQLSIG